jgi:hypothetical protein
MGPIELLMVAPVSAVPSVKVGTAVVLCDDGPPKYTGT